MTRPAPAPVMRPNVARRKRRVRVVEVHLVERVEELAAQLQAQVRTEVDVAHQGKVACSRRPVRRSDPRGVAVDAARDAVERHERRGVEVHARSCRRCCCDPGARRRRSCPARAARYWPFGCRMPFCATSVPIVNTSGLPDWMRWKPVMVHPFSSAPSEPVGERVLRAPHPRRRDDMPAVEERRPPQRLEIERIGNAADQAGRVLRLVGHVLRQRIRSREREGSRHPAIDPQLQAVIRAAEEVAEHARLRADDAGTERHALLDVLRVSAARPVIGELMNGAALK